MQHKALNVKMIINNRREVITIKFEAPIPGKQAVKFGILLSGELLSVGRVEEKLKLGIWNIKQIIET